MAATRLLLLLSALCSPRGVAAPVVAASQRLSAFATPMSVKFGAAGAVVSLCATVNLTVPPIMYPFYDPSSTHPVDGK